MIAALLAVTLAAAPSPKAVPEKAVGLSKGAPMEVAPPPP